MWYQMSDEPQHWPTERMIAEGHADYATPADIEALDTGLLEDISVLCKVDTWAPDECIPCLAGVTVVERRKAEVEAALAPPEPTYPDPEPGSPADLSVPPFDRTSKVEFGEVSDEDLTRAEEAMSLVPVAERFASHVNVLQQLVVEMLQGPPIPPREVTLNELGALVLGAKRWLAMLDSQELTLSPDQEAIRQEVRRVVDKVTS